MKGKKPLLIVRGMKQLLAVLALVFLASAPALAQSSGFGFLVGGAQPADDGLTYKLNNTVREAFYDTQLEPGTLFRIKIGQTETERDAPPVGIPGFELDGKIEYIDAFVEYRFYEVFGSTGLFFGPGLYRRRFGNDEETNYGLGGGVNALFPVTRRLAFIGEPTYRWANFEDDRAFLTATGGLRITF